MKNMITLSVMIPVYNVEKFVHRAIKSVAVQPMAKHMEIIVVDDGSKDNSGLICDKLQREYRNIIVIHQENAGVAMARNLGVSIARGKYIAFLDADDWWDSNFYDETLQMELESNDYDIIGFSYRSISSDISFCTPFHVKEKVDTYDNFATGRFWYYPFWAFMYRTDFLKENNLELFPVKINEDTSFTERCFCVARNVRWIDRNICNHWNNMSSVSTTMNWKAYFDEHYKSYLYMQDWYAKYGIAYDVDSRAAIIFSIILKDLCAYNSYHFVRKIFDENKKYHIVYEYEKLDLHDSHKKILGEWIQRPRRAWLKYHTVYRVKHDVVVFIYHHKKLNHFANYLLFTTIFKHDRLSRLEKKYINGLE